MYFAVVIFPLLDWYSTQSFKGYLASILVTWTTLIAVRGFFEITFCMYAYSILATSYFRRHFNDIHHSVLEICTDTGKRMVYRRMYRKSTLMRLIRQLKTHSLLCVMLHQDCKLWNCIHAVEFGFQVGEEREKVK